MSARRNEILREMGLAPLWRLRDAAPSGHAGHEHAVPAPADSPGASGLSLNLFDPSAIFSGSLTAAVLFCLGSFMGFEATTIYAEGSA